MILGQKGDCCLNWQNFVIKLSVDFKKSVSIVTSNYDTFIEDSIIKELYIPYAKKKKKKKGKTSTKDFKDFDVDLRLVGYAYGGGGQRSSLL